MRYKTARSLLGIISKVYIAIATIVAMAISNAHAAEDTVRLTPDFYLDLVKDTTIKGTWSDPAVKSYNLGRATLTHFTEYHYPHGTTSYTEFFDFKFRGGKKDKGNSKKELQYSTRGNLVCYARKNQEANCAKIFLTKKGIELEYPSGGSVYVQELDRLDGELDLTKSKARKKVIDLYEQYKSRIDTQPSAAAISTVSPTTTPVNCPQNTIPSDDGTCALVDENQIEPSSAVSDPYTQERVKIPTDFVKVLLVDSTTYGNYTTHNTNFVEHLSASGQLEIENYTDARTSPIMKGIWTTRGSSICMDYFSVTGQSSKACYDLYLTNNGIEYQNLRGIVQSKITKIENVEFGLIDFSDTSKNWFDVIQNAMNPDGNDRGASSRKGTSTGSGFFISKNLIVTNHHVIEGAAGLKILYNDEIYDAVLITQDRDRDLAILKVASTLSTSPTCFSLANFAPITPGRKVYAAGFPLAGTLSSDVKLTDGIISSKNGLLDDPTTFQLTTALQPGNSGGPIFDELGRLAGIAVSKLRSGENISFAIKPSYAKSLFDNSGQLDTCQVSLSSTGSPLNNFSKAVALIGASK